MESDSGLGKLVGAMAVGAVVLMALAYFLFGGDRLPAPDAPRSNGAAPPPVPSSRVNSPTRSVPTTTRDAPPRNGAATLPPRSNPGPKPAMLPRHSDVARTPPGADATAAPSTTGNANGALSPELVQSLTAISAMASRREQREALENLGMTLAARGFDAALREAAELGDEQQRNYLMRGIFRYQGAIDPRGAITQALAYEPVSDATGSSGNEPLFRGVLTAAIAGWATQEPNAALQYTERLPTTYREQAVEAVYTGWADVDPKAALLSAGGQSRELRDNVLPAIYQSWSRVDPQAAGNHAASLPDIDEESRKVYVTSILKDWAATDVDAAVSWADQAITDNQTFAVLMGEVAKGLTYSNPRKAADLIETIPELSSMAAGLSYRLAGEWSKRAPADAAAWVQSLKDDSWRGTAMKTVAANWAEQDTESAVAWAESLASETDKATALGSIASQQGEKEGAAQSTDWLAKLPTGFVRNRSLVGYAIGVMRRERDYGALGALQETIGSDSVDMVRASEIIGSSQIPQAARGELLRLF